MVRLDFTWTMILLSGQTFMKTQTKTSHRCSARYSAFGGDQHSTHFHFMYLTNQWIEFVKLNSCVQPPRLVPPTHFPFPWRCIFSIVLPLPDALTCKNRSLKLRQNIRLINSTFYLDLHIHSPLRWTCLYFSSKVSTHHSRALWYVCFHLVMNWSLSYLVITSVS